MRQTRALVALMLLFIGAGAYADHWRNRPNAVAAAGRMAYAVEAFDELLHGVDAPEAIVSKTHHLEETVLDLVADLAEMPRAAAQAEVRHVQQDIQIMQRDFFRNFRLMTNLRLLRAFQQMYRSFGDLYLQVQLP